MLCYPVNYSTPSNTLLYAKRMKPYSNFAFIAGLVCFFAIILVAVFLAVQFPDGGIDEGGSIILSVKLLVILFLLNSAILWINGIRILRERWNRIGEYEKLFWLLAMVCLVGIIGYILWYLERRQER